MRPPLVVELYRELPQPQMDHDADLWSAGIKGSLERFRRQVKKRYTEGTLERLLNSPNAEARRAAVLGLSLIGRMSINAAVAARLQDDDPLVRRLSSEALWSIWFRGEDIVSSRELKRVLRQRNPKVLLKRLDALVEKAGSFAEAFNQRAIVHFGMGDFDKAIVDCRQVLKLNPHHFGAAAGMAQCYMKLNKPRAALRSFKTALQINPNLDDVKEAIRDLEEALGG